MTLVRDYIHITDLITGHLKALEKINDNLEYKAYNLGTGKGISVLEVISEFERILNINIKKKFVKKDTETLLNIIVTRLKPT